MATIVVTGSSSGFGRLTAETLAKAGHTVFATMRQTNGKNAPAAKELKAFSAANGDRVRIVDLDVTSEASVRDAIASIAQQANGVIDVVFNNAGRFSAGVQEAYSLDEAKGLFDTNVFGPLRVNRAALPYMRKRGSGLIIYSSSIAGRFSLPCLGLYSASKFALEALAEAQRDELKPLGIDVVIIEPGAYPTQVSNNGLYPIDTACADQYGAVASIPQKLGEGLAQLFASPDAPNPQAVADAVKTLVDTPAGQRPHRVVIDNFTGEPVRTLNEAYVKHRLALMTAFGMT